jgi:tetraacyldisaccharide 4'-kinase
MSTPHPTYWHRLISGQARGVTPALARAGLSAAAAVYSGAVRLRNGLYDLGMFRARRLPVPVISVGNLTVGGTGKTPFVELVCRKLRDLGRRPAILTRGYKAGAHGSDEAGLLAERLPDVPVVVNPDRVAGGREAIARGADVLVLDDGFQHRRLARDLDIVLVDAVHPFGYGAVLPAGLLREPPSGLARAHLVVRTRCPVDDPVGLRHPGRPFPDVPVLRCRHSPTDFLLHDGDGPPAAEPVESLRARGLFAFCGLADPAAFVRSLRDWGCEVRGERHFPDHHAFTADDVAALAAARPFGATAVTTEKDFQRLLWLPAEVRRALHPLAVVRIRMEILSGGRDLDRALRSVLPQS